MTQSPHLVDHQQVLILIHDAQRQGLRRRLQRRRRQHAGAHQVARPHAVRRLGLQAVQQHGMWVRLERALPACRRRPPVARLVCRPLPASQAGPGEACGRTCGRPLTATRPPLMDACRRARLAAGSRAARNASSRSLACGGGVVMRRSTNPERRGAKRIGPCQGRPDACSWQPQAGRQAAQQAQARRSAQAAATARPHRTARTLLASKSVSETSSSYWWSCPWFPPPAAAVCCSCCCCKGRGGRRRRQAAALAAAAAAVGGGQAWRMLPPPRCP